VQAAAFATIAVITFALVYFFLKLLELPRLSTAWISDIAGAVFVAQMLSGPIDAACSTCVSIQTSATRAGRGQSPRLRVTDCHAQMKTGMSSASPTRTKCLKGCNVDLSWAATALMEWANV